MTSTDLMYYGRPASPPVKDLTAGPLKMHIEGANLHRITVGGVELVQQIYVAVRDVVWNNITATYTDYAYDIAFDHFVVSFKARHQFKEMDFEWIGTIEGRADGTVVYTMDGVANEDFSHCKLGFNIHHPLLSKGKPYRAQSIEGEVTGTIPVHVEPQKVDNGVFSTIVPAYTSLSIEIEKGVVVTTSLEGDSFELQDHRNWTEGNFKSYGTPMTVPFPMHLKKGDHVRQQVTVSVSAGSEARPADTEPTKIRIGDAAGKDLPSIGTGMSSVSDSLSDRQIGLLQPLRLDHLRVDLHLGQPYAERLDNAARQAKRLNAHLELAIYVRISQAEQELQQLASKLDEHGRDVARVLVLIEPDGFSATGGSTPGSMVRLAKQHLLPKLPQAAFIGGTDKFFAEVNRDRPEMKDMDGMCFTSNPQVHAGDDITVMENVPAQADAVRTAETFSEGKPVVISPITLGSRSGPFPAGPAELNPIHPEVDVRHAALFGACWTFESLRHLIHSNVDSVTYYETVGWRGWMELEEGSSKPDLFPSSPGDVFPAYHVMADLAEGKRGTLIATDSTRPLTADAICMEVNGTKLVTAANMTRQIQCVEIGPFKGTKAAVRTLDETTVHASKSSAAAFRNSYEELDLVGGGLVLELLPYSTVRIQELHQI